MREFVISWNNFNFEFPYLIDEIKHTIHKITDINLQIDLKGVLVQDHELIYSEQIKRHHHRGRDLKRVRIPIDFEKRLIEIMAEDYDEDSIDSYRREFILQPFSTIILGEYDHQEKKLILYTKAIAEYSNDYKLKEADVLAATFANLCFRVNAFYEADKVGAEFVKAYAYQKSLSVLSAYFEYEFCQHANYLQVANVMRDNWERKCCVAWVNSLAFPMLYFDGRFCKCDYGTFRSAYYKWIKGENAYSIIDACVNLCNLY